MCVLVPFKSLPVSNLRISFQAHSLSSHVQRIRVPSTSNAKEISDYLDEIFDPLTLGYGDDEEYHLVRPDAKTLAASIKGGGAKSGQDLGPVRLRLVMFHFYFGQDQHYVYFFLKEFRRLTANASAQSAAYPYGVGITPMIPQYGIPQLPSTLGFYPPMGKFSFHTCLMCMCRFCRFVAVLRIFCSACMTLLVAAHAFPYVPSMHVLPSASHFAHARSTDSLFNGASLQTATPVPANSHVPPALTSAYSRPYFSPAMSHAGSLESMLDNVPDYMMQHALAQQSLVFQSPMHSSHHPFLRSTSVNTAGEAYYSV